MDNDVALALYYHRNGWFDQAEPIYLRILHVNPDHADALHLLGVIAHQRGNHERAVELIGQAIARNPSVPAFHANLTEAYGALNQLANAEASARAALQLQPNHPEALHNLGIIQFKQKRYAEAEASFREALRLRPNFAAAAGSLADTLRKQGQGSEALAVYKQVIELDANHRTAHGHYGVLLLQRGELEQGLYHCRRAVALTPDSAEAHASLSKLLLEFGRIEEAIDALAEALRLEPDSPRLCANMGHALIQRGDLAEAKVWLDRALAIEPEMAEARCHQAAILLEEDHAEAAIDIYTRVLEREPDRVMAHTGLAHARLELGDVAGAVASHREAIKLRPDDARLHAALGHTLSTAGDLEGAVASHRQAIACNHRCVPANAGLVTILRSKTTDDEIRAIEGLLTVPWMTAQRRAALHFGLAQANDGRGDYAKAAENMVAANALQKQHFEERGKGYDPAENHEQMQRRLAAFTPEYFRRVASWGRSTQRPVFIVGMPRSSTTLTEQILASHPRVFGAGERRFANLGFHKLPDMLEAKESPVECLDRLPRYVVEQLADWHLEQMRSLDQGRADRVVDKMPDNYQLLGWIVTLFPKAKIIHCKRDLRDVALSCWITNFAQIRWANDLDHLAERILDYLRYMDHWRTVLPVPMLEVEYEQTVEDQEGTSRRLLDFVELEWDPAVLSFHKTERLVRTASESQVRQPIYKRSVARWRHYETMLEPLLNKLAGVYPAT